jgi:hypothetical protein
VARDEVTGRRPRIAQESAERRAVYTVNEFCLAHSISPAMYYKMKALGLGPVEMAIGSRRLISFESAAAWRAAREAASA